MNNYKGYLLKFGGTILPNHYFTDYSSTPAQRQEADAQVDQNGHLHRETMPHKRSSIRFTTHFLTLDEKIDLQSIMGYSGSLQRRVNVTYWNDETNDYSNADFYLPDVEFSVQDASDTDIQYNPISFELIEY